mmetsp:Transcript_16362/g.20729  ORF Transcript_16362/g.20729 Transcript_16362/m.20729 type:complete len:92 (-) Transcript_16362:28-303(-)
MGPNEILIMGGRETQDERLDDIIVFNTEERTVADISDEDCPITFESTGGATLLDNGLIMAPVLDDYAEPCLLKYDCHSCKVSIVTRPINWR